MKSFYKLIVSMVLILSMLVGMTAFCAYAESEEGTYLYVGQDEIGSYGFRRAVQRALDEAHEYATADHPYTVTAAEGSYNLDSVLRVYSNTTLFLTNVTLKRSGAGAGNMLRVGSEDGVNSGVTGYVYENIRVIGGTFDGNFGENTIIKAFHTKNFTMEDVTVKNEKEGHMTEFAGVDGLTVRGCTFSDQRLTPGNYGYEAIQIDVLHPFHITNGRCEDLPVTNVLIENCYFENMPRAVGSHTAVHNRPHNYITIRNNTFKDMSSIAVQGMNWTNVDISRNVIENAPRGITVYSEPGGCTYLSGKLAQKGGTQSHASDSYQTPPKSNIKIYYNILKNIGSTADAYSWYSSQGIAVLGEKLDERSPVDSGDESGGLPAGDYYIDGASIHDNYIDVRGNGVRVEDARNVSVADNEIICSKNTVVGGEEYHGIKFRDNVSASAVSYNYIRNAETNGIHLDGGGGGKVNKVCFNRIEKSGKYGIGIYDMSLDKIEDNDILNTVNTGLFLADSRSDSLKWNRIRNCSKSGIWITSSSPGNSVIGSNTTVGCKENDSFGRNSADSHYSSGASLTDYYIPWDTKGKVGAEMGVGAIFHIVPDVRPTNALASFTFTSSNEDVAAVDASGMVYGVGEGRATITVKSNNGVTKKYVVTVKGSGGVKHLESTPAAPVLIRGDADGNGAVESIGVTLIWRRIAYIAVTYPDVTLMHGDVDEDGALTVIDVSNIQRYLSKLQTNVAIGGSY